MWPEIDKIAAYIQFVRHEPTNPNGNPQECILEDLMQRLTAGKGIINYTAHGSSSSRWYVAIDTFGTDQAACDARKAQYDSQYPGLIVKSSFPNGSESHYFLKIDSSMTTAWCSAFYSIPHAIAFTTSCGTTDQGLNAFNAIVSFGYADTVSTSESSIDAQGIFSRMNGTVGSGQYRGAYQAYTAYGDSTVPCVQMYGDDQFLCPIARVCPENLDSNNYPKDGNGYVLFDAGMKWDEFPASVAVTISGASWKPNGAPVWSNLNKIVFGYTRSTPGWIYIRVNGWTPAKITAGTLIIDGNNNDPLQPRGVAPNGDTYCIKFYGN